MSILFLVDFLYAHKPHCYTRFYTLQPPRAHFLCSSPAYVPARIVSRHAPSRLQLSLSSLYFHLLTWVYQPFNPFFIGYDHSRLQHLLLLAYSKIEEISLPAYLNNIMNKYKAIMHQFVGRRTGISA